MTKLGKAEVKNSAIDNQKMFLEGKKEELTKNLAMRREELLKSHGHEPDDEGAAALESVTRDLVITSMERDVRTLAEIDMALRRLREGEYGVCERCDGTIGEARLKALPWTRICIRCAEAASGGVYSPRTGTLG